MRPRQTLASWLLALAALAVLLQSEVVGADGGEIETTLYPGWNLIGWLEPDAPVHALFERIPGLQAVHGQEESQGAERGPRWRDISEESDERISTGDAIWLLVGGTRPLVLRQRATKVPPQQLAPGVSAVTWAWPQEVWPGRDLLAQTAWTEDEKRLLPWDAVSAVVGSELLGFWRWHAQEQAFELYLRGQTAASERGITRELQPGEAILVVQRGHGSWTLPGHPPILNSQSLTAAEEDALRESARDAKSYFKARLTWAPKSALVIRIERWSDSSPCSHGGGGGHRRLYLSCDRLQHLTWEALSAGYAETYANLSAPPWLKTGVPNYVALRYRSDRGIQEYRGAREHLIGVSRSTPLRLEDLERIYSSVDQPSMQWASLAFLQRAIGTLAVDWLAETYGEQKVWQFIGLLGETPWRDALARAFGLSDSRILAEFEAYRETLSRVDGRSFWMQQPLHQVIFSGPMTEARWELIEAVRDIVDVMQARHGVTTSAASFVLELTNDEYAREEYRLTPISCGRAPRSLIFALVECSTPYVIAHEYYHLLQREVRGSEWVPNAPTWLFEGSADYAALGYTTHGVALGVSSREDVMLELARRAESVAEQVGLHLPAQDLAAGALERSPYTVGQFAVRMLAERVGERAILRAFGTEWAEGGDDDASRFESVFGWPFNDFLQEFGEWLRDLNPG